jgi:hypothetical protein
MDKETWHLFHKLWTRAVGTPDYNKKDWQELVWRIDGLPTRHAGEPQTPDSPSGSQPRPTAWARLLKG